MIISGCDGFMSWGRTEPDAVASTNRTMINPAQEYNKRELKLPIKDRAIRISPPKIETSAEELSHGIAMINMENNGQLLYQNEYGKEVAEYKTSSIKSTTVYNKGQIQPVNPGIKIRAPIILTDEELFKGARDTVKGQLESALKGGLNLDGYIKICSTMLTLVKSPAEKLWWERALAQLNKHKVRSLIYERQGRDSSTPLLDQQIETNKLNH